VSAGTSLKPVIGTFQLIAYSIGVIVGAGVYSVIGVAAGLAGASLWLSFIIGAVIALLTALSYAEMTTAFPGAGAEHAYMRLAFPDAAWASFGIGAVILIGGAATATTVAVAFGGYLAQFFPVPVLLSAFLLLAACTILNILGLQESSVFNVLFTAIEVVGLLLVIALGLRQETLLAPVAEFRIEPGLMAASAVIFFVYLGFEEVANISEEVHNPARSIPLAIFVSLGVTTVLYVLVALSAIALATPAELASSAAPLATAVAKVWPSGAVLLSAIALFATANTVLITLIATSRLAFAMAREGDLPDDVARLLPERRTPWIAALLAFAISALLLPIGQIGLLAGLSSFAALLAFLAVNATLIVLRVQYPEHPRPFRTPLRIGPWPLLPVVAIALIVILMMYFEHAVYVGGAVAIALAALFFLLMAWSKRRDG
jgi:amino acid transporter